MIDFEEYRNKWRHPSLIELTPMIFDLKLTDLGYLLVMNIC